MNLNLVVRHITIVKLVIEDAIEIIKSHHSRVVHVILFSSIDFIGQKIKTVILFVS